MESRKLTYFMKRVSSCIDSFSQESFNADFSFAAVAVCRACQNFIHYSTTLRWSKVIVDVAITQ